MRLRFDLIITKEGLILLGLAFVLQAAHFFFFSKVEYTIPKYQLQLSTGSVMYIPIYPEVSLVKKSPRVLLQEMYHPTPELVSKRIKEFSTDNKLKVVKSSPVVTWKDRVKEQLGYFLCLNFFLQLLFIYAFIGVLRFLFWSIKTLKATSVTP